MEIEEKFQGASAYRWKENLLERAFSEAWQKINTLGSGPTMIEYALDPENRGAPYPPITERENLLAATLIQWLGSPVGQDFLLGVLSGEDAQELRLRLRDEQG